MPNAASWLPLGMLGVLAAGSVAQADYARIVTAPGGDSPMVYDDHRSRLLAIARDGLFEWDGSSWNLRYGVAGWLGIHAFYDPYDHRIAALASYFEGRFDGARWTSVAIPTAPSAVGTSSLQAPSREGCRRSSSRL